RRCWSRGDGDRRSTGFFRITRHARNCLRPLRVFANGTCALFPCKLIPRNQIQHRNPGRVVDWPSALWNLTRPARCTPFIKQGTDANNSKAKGARKQCVITGGTSGIAVAGLFAELPDNRGCAPAVDQRAACAAWSL